MDLTTDTANRYQLLVDSIRDYAIYMLDARGYVVSWNAGAERFKGYTAAEIIGQHFSRFYTPEDRAIGLPQTALNTAATLGSYENEGWRLRKDGSRFWTHVVIDPIRDGLGAVIGYAKITRDLTERMQAQVQTQALAQSTKQLGLLVQSVTDYAIYMLDARGHVMSWNAGAERIKGYAANEILGEHFSRFYTAEDRAAGEPARSLSIAVERGRFEKEGWRLRKDGTRFWANVVIDTIKDEQGRLLGFAKVTRDFTERRENQRQLDAAREALFQSQKMEAVGQLTGGIAHDFNNLLSAVMGSLELLRKRLPVEPRTTALLDNALLGVQRGSALTQRMLAFARRQELRVEPVNVIGLLQGMVELLERAVGPGLRIDMRFPLSLPLARVDPHQLESALLNLVVNARDAMPEGEALTIAAQATELAAGSAIGLPPGDYVRISVIDAGEGMDTATLVRAVEPFFTTKGVGKGTGLGLSMVHGLAEQSGGRLELQSMLGKGTTATIWLPVSPVLPVPLDAAKERPHLQASRGASPLRILVVDDDALVLSNLTAMLEELGHSVTPVSSGGEALQLLRDRPAPDLLLTDHFMPTMTGYQLALQTREMLPDLPVLLVTGYAELEAGPALRMMRLAKPFQLVDLGRAIASACTLTTVAS